MTTNELKARIYDIQGEIKSTMDEMHLAGRELKECTYGWRLDNSAYGLLNAKQTMERVYSVSSAFLEKYDKYIGLLREQEGLEKELKRRKEEG